MTNSTESQGIKKAKPAKAGLIRWGATGPFVIVVLVIYLYFSLLFDGHARHILESVASRANGAEVDISSLHTSFWSASLEIRDVQVTNHDEPSKNAIEIGSIKWHMLWDALLRGKIAIDEASVLDIRVGTLRKHPGYVIPPDPPAATSNTEQVRQQALGRVQQEFNGNLLGDVASLLNGSDPKDQLKSLEGTLKSEARVKELQSELKQKESEWSQRLKSLPQEKDLQALNERVKHVKTSGFKNPGEVQSSLNEINGIIKDANSQVQQVQATATALNGDVNKYQTALKELDQLVRDDAKALESRFKIPQVDAEAISRVIFGPTLFAKVKRAEFYMSKAREYMPPKKTAAQKEAQKAEIPKPHERHKGRNYKFGSPKSYPLFWLKKASISSKSSGSEFSGDLEGSILNLTDDPPTLGLPTSLVFKGDFPKQGIHGVNGDLTIDHTTESARESLLMQVSSMAITEHNLLSSAEAKIGFNKAQGSSGFRVNLENEHVDMKLESAFDRVDYNIEAKNKVVSDLLTKTFRSLPKITLLAMVGGVWSDLKINVDTNLARELQIALGRELQAKIAEAKVQIQKVIDQRIGEQKKKLTDQFNSVQNQVKGQLASKQAEVEKAKASFEKTKNEAVKGQSKQLEQQGKKAVDKLKSKFGF